MTSRPTPLPRDARIASVLSVGAHVLLIASLTRCPAQAPTGWRVARPMQTARRPAPQRLAFITMRPSSSPAGATRARPRPPSPAVTSREIEVAVADSTFDGAVDSVGSAAITPARGTVVDSGPPPVVEYERPLHPALRGLVPAWNGGALWRGMVSGGARPSVLAPRPNACVEGVPGYFACARRLHQWRQDSIYHVSIRCRRDTAQIARALPSDCARFRPDSSKR